MEVTVAVSGTVLANFRACSRKVKPKRSPTSKTGNSSKDDRIEIAGEVCSNDGAFHRAAHSQARGQGKQYPKKTKTLGTCRLPIFEGTGLSGVPAQSIICATRFSFCRVEAINETPLISNDTQNTDKSKLVSYIRPHANDGPPGTQTTCPISTNDAPRRCRPSTVALPTPSTPTSLYVAPNDTK